MHHVVVTSSNWQADKQIDPAAAILGRHSVEYHGTRRNSNVRTPQPMCGTGHHHMGVIESNSGVGLTPELPRQVSSDLFKDWNMRDSTPTTIVTTSPSITLPSYGIPSNERAYGSGTVFQKASEPLKMEGPFEAIPQTTPSRVVDSIRTNPPSAFTEIGTAGGSAGKDAEREREKSGEIFFCF